ncbi:hypothetical protein V8E51_019099 [Hyaloscypha variabilis]
MANTMREHKTSPIPLEEFQVGFLKPASYSEEDIADVMVKHLNRKPEDITTRQKEGLARFKYNGSWSLAKTENLEDLEKFFDIFNDVYFNGVLTGYARINRLSWLDMQRRFGYGGLEGFCQPIRQGNELDPRFRIMKPSVEIAISTAFTGTKMYRIQNHLLILLHEMVHAIFFIFKCGCDHGSVAHAVEEADRETGHLLGLNLDLRRELCLANDVHRGGLNLPNDAVLRLLGLDIRRILKMQKYLREEFSKMEKPIIPGHAANRCIRNTCICTDNNSSTL